jgi:hypothetical protein
MRERLMRHIQQACLLARAWKLWAIQRLLLCTCVVAVLCLAASAQMTVRLTPGDVSGDNIIDDQDLLAVLFGFGSTDPDLDITGDGRVDDADLLLVLFGFGQSGAEAFSGARQPANGAVAMQVRIEVEGYQQGFVQLPVVVEAQKHSGGVVYRYEGVLWSNPGEVWISVPEGGGTEYMLS